MVICKNCKNQFDEYFGICPNCGAQYIPEEQPKSAIPPISDWPDTFEKNTEDYVPVDQISPQFNAQQPPVINQPVDQPFDMQGQTAIKQPKKKSKGKRITIIAILCALLLAGGAAVSVFYVMPQIKQHQIEEQVSNGEKQLEEKNYTEAAESFKKAIELDSYNSRYYEKLGESYLAQGDKYGEAEEALKKAIELDPDNPTYYIKLADLYTQIDVSEKAIETLEEGFKKTSDSAVKSKLDQLKLDTQYNLYIENANTAKAAGNYSEAVQNYMEAIKLKPDIYKTYIYAAEVYMAQNDADSAIAVLEQGRTVTNSEDIVNKISEINSSIENNNGNSFEGIDITSEKNIRFLKEAMKKEAIDGVVKLKVWCSSDDRNIEQELTSEFKKMFEDSELIIDIKVGVSNEDQAVAKLIENPEDAADVFSFTNGQLLNLIDSRCIARLPDYFKGNVTKDNTSDSIAAFTVDDYLYAYPVSSDAGCVMYYDKRVFKDNEVGNIDKMIAIAEKNNKSVFFDLSSPWYNTGFFLTAGCRLEYKNNKQIIEYANTKGLNAAKAMCHIAENTGKGFIGTSGTMGINDYVVSGFEKGELAAAVVATTTGSRIKKVIGNENVGAAKLPTVLIDCKQQQLHSFGGYMAKGVNLYSRVPFTAHLLACYLTSSKNQEYLYKSSGVIPTNKEVLDDDNIKNDPALKAIQDQTPYTHSQGSVVGLKYWSSYAGLLGVDIVSKSGKVSDDSLMTALKKIDNDFS